MPTVIALATVTVAAARTIDIPLRPARGVYPIERFQPATPRLTLAFSGGGGRGVAHLGVLKALDKADLRPDGIAGSSIGALIGSLYAGGMSPDEIAGRLRRVDWTSLLLDEPERRSLLLARKAEHSRHLLTVRLGRNLAPVVPGAIAPGQKLYRQLLRLTLDTPIRSPSDWDGLAVPLRIVATDLSSGRQVVFDRGDPAPAVRASMSLPLLFDPLPLDELQLIDGGITSNIPVEIAREMGGDVVVAVNVTSSLHRPQTPWLPWQIVDQVTTILERETNARSLAGATLAITPTLQNDPNLPPEPFDSLIAAGYGATMEALDTLRRLLEPPALPDDADTLAVARWVLPDDSPDLPAAPSAQRMGGVVTVREVRDHLRRLYASGVVRRAAAEFDEPSGTLSIRVILTPMVRSLRLEGERLLADSLILRSLATQTGKRLDYEEFGRAVVELQRLYRQAGYPAARVAGASLDSITGELTVLLDPGLLGEVRFAGLERVSESWLSHEVPLAAGDPISREGILEGTANLYATGLFRSVYPFLQPPSDGGPLWTVAFYVSEHPAPLVRLGLAYQDEQRTRGFAELTYPSPFSYAARGVLFTSVGERDQAHRLELTTDKIVGRPLAVSLTGGLNRRARSYFTVRHNDSSYYDEARWGARLKIGGQAWSWGLLSAIGRWEWHNNDYSGAREHYRLTALGGELGLDTEDRSPYPNRGVRLTAAVETAAEQIGSQRDFTRTWGAWEAFMTPLRRHTVGLKLSLGSASSYTPFDEQFRLGGMQSFPGLHLDELVATRQAAAGCEYRFDMLSRVLADSYIGVRYDAGGSWDDPSRRINRIDWLNSVAIYFALDTVLGPIHLQWGHLYGAAELSPQDVFSIQAGNIF